MAANDEAGPAEDGAAIGVLAWLRLVLEWAGAAAAIFGGVVLTGAALFIAVSVIAAGFGRPILGANEVVQLAAGVAVASFMPWCQLRNGHIFVTVFTERAPALMRLMLDLAAALLTAVVATVVAWRLLIGGLESHARGRVSMFLEIPQWWGFAAVSLPTVLWAVAAAFMVLERLRGIEPAPRLQTDGT